MSTTSEFSVGLIHEFLVTATKVGFEPADIAKLTKSEKRCGQVLQLIHGQVEVKPKRLLIDLSADPFCPKGLTVEEHIKAKPWKFDAKQIELYLDPAQSGGSILGHDLRNVLKGKPVLNANVLNWLLQEENQHLIPEEWKGKYVFFWGTIYRRPAGSLSVRYLRWSGGQWGWFWLWLDDRWDEAHPAALLASPL